MANYNCEETIRTKLKTRNWKRKMKIKPYIFSFNFAVFSLFGKFDLAGDFA